MSSCVRAVGARLGLCAYLRDVSCSSPCREGSEPKKRTLRCVGADAHREQEGRVQCVNEEADPDQVPASLGVGGQVADSQPDRTSCPKPGPDSEVRPRVHP
jgi:hypothetical protein